MFHFIFAIIIEGRAVILLISLLYSQEYFSDHDNISEHWITSQIENFCNEQKKEKKKPENLNKLNSPLNA